MKPRRILFVCYPDTNSPIGGVKQIYRQAELLQQEGFDAFVLQQEPGFRPDWFESKARVIDLKSYLDSPPAANEDLIILPETWLKNVPSYLVGIPKVIFNQNAFYSFGLESNCDPSTLELYQHPDIKGVLTVSEDSRRLLVEGCGIDSKRCTALINGIDANLFYVPNQKAPHIVFIGRKQADHARKVALMAKGRPAFSNYNFRELPRMPHEEIAKELRDALMFLSCGHPEGFGLPLAEAIACGCLVVGYHGLGGRDFALPHMRVVEFGDLMGFLDGIEAELKRFEANPNAVIQERSQASRTIQEMYSLEEERLSCLNAWQSLAI